MATHHFQPTRYYTTIGSHEPVLRIQPGDRIGLVGANGSGKTTIGRILTRLYLPGAGEVLVDGLPVRSCVVPRLSGQSETITALSAMICIRASSVR